MYGLGVETSPSAWESIGSAVGAIAVGLLAQKQQEKVLKAQEKATAKQLAAEIAAAQAITDAQIAAMQQPSISRTFAGLPLWAWIAVPGLGMAAYFLAKRRRAYGRRRR